MSKKIIKDVFSKCFFFFLSQTISYFALSIFRKFILCVISKCFSFWKFVILVSKNN